MDRSKKAVDAARQGQEKELRMLAKEAGAWDPDKGFIIIGDDGQKVFMNPNQFKDALKRGDEAANKFQTQLAAKVTGGAGGQPRGSNLGSNLGGAAGGRPGFHVGDVISALTTGNFGGVARELIQPFGSGK